MMFTRQPAPRASMDILTNSRRSPSGEGPLCVRFQVLTLHLSAKGNTYRLKCSFSCNSRSSSSSTEARVLVWTFCSTSKRSTPCTTTSEITPTAPIPPTAALNRSSSGPHSCTSPLPSISLSATTDSLTNPHSLPVPCTSVERIPAMLWASWEGSAEKAKPSSSSRATTSRTRVPPLCGHLFLVQVLPDEAAVVIEGNQRFLRRGA